MLENLLIKFETASAVCIPLLIVAIICAIFVIVVVMMQSSNSNGISALGGQQETFYGKNKGKTMEHKLRRLTVVNRSGSRYDCVLRYRFPYYGLIIFVSLRTLLKRPLIFL